MPHIVVHSLLYNLVYTDKAVLSKHVLFPGMIAMCGTEGELQETMSRLTDINTSAHSALRVIEMTPHQVRDPLDSVIRKTEC